MFAVTTSSEQSKLCGLQSRSYCATTGTNPHLERPPLLDPLLDEHLPFLPLNVLLGHVPAAHLPVLNTQDVQGLFRELSENI